MNYCLNMSVTYLQESTPFLESLNVLYYFLPFFAWQTSFYASLSFKNHLKFHLRKPPLQGWTYAVVCALEWYIAPCTNIKLSLVRMAHCA